ncbi:unnamed protein product [Haemonchus placei]|uniref:Uncharacterized protein n=1 Tax=Haemonchus placei TaxID=6290 RepID=A0A0N4W4G2_HAEPC|nr:unnamed protein product [Haemonchus placei]
MKGGKHSTLWHSTGKMKTVRKTVSYFHCRITVLPLRRHPIQ